MYACPELSPSLHPQSLPYRAGEDPTRKEAYHAIHSPYIFGRSPLTYASNVRFITTDQSKSRLSSLTSSPSVSVIFTLCRPTCSPAMNRAPRSGKFLVGSNGFHQKLWKWYEKAPRKNPWNPSAWGAALLWAGVSKKSLNLEWGSSTK